MSNKRLKVRKKVITLCCIILFIVFSIIGGHYINIYINKKKNIEASTIENIDINADFITKKEINPEYIGEIIFDNGLLQELLVQTIDNEKYLNYAWDLKKSSHGSAYIDFRNSLDDQNIIIYGHYVYDNENIMFGPLHKLTKEENYNDNKYITLKLENEERHYIVTYVYYYVMDSQTLKYYETNYDENFFKIYVSELEKKQLYDTGETLNYNDKWLTLQTCVRNRDDLRLIIVAKEINI